MNVLWDRLQDLWNAILDFTAKLVIPDWSGLILLIPVGVAALVALWFAVTILRFARAGPKRRGKRRLKPIPPPGEHAPGPSFAPVFGAIGLFAIFIGILLGGVALLLGAAALVLVLLYWGREAMTDYDHIAGSQETLPAVIREPPPGVHAPGPSFRPILGALGLFVLFYGLVLKGPLLFAGLIVLVITLVGWLVDARREYNAAVEMDRTGHLDPGPAPGYPVKTIALSAIVVLIAVSIQTGFLPPASATGPGASGAPGGSALPPGSGGPAASGGPPASGGSPAPAGDVKIDAQALAFVQTEATAPAGKPFTIAFDNQDPSTLHNVAIHKDNPAGAEVFKGDLVTGPKVVVYNVPALDAGTYAFVCTVHPSMQGTLAVK